MLRTVGLKPYMKFSYMKLWPCATHESLMRETVCLELNLLFLFRLNGFDLIFVSWARAGVGPPVSSRTFGLETVERKGLRGL